MPENSPKLTARMVSSYCDLRLAPVLAPHQLSAVHRYLMLLLDKGAAPPFRGERLDMAAIAECTQISEADLGLARLHLQSILDALRRSARAAGGDVTEGAPPLSSSRPSARKSDCSDKPVRPAGNRFGEPRCRPGPKPRPVVEFPKPLSPTWDEPGTFAASLCLHIERHADSVRHLCRAVSHGGYVLDQRTLTKWCMGEASPQSVHSLEILNRIERRYGLPKGYFRKLLPHQTRATRGYALEGVSPAERRRLAWHLPDDFDTRALAEQEEILAWVRTVIISGSTDYRRFQAAAMKQRYAVRFKSLSLKLKNAWRDDEEVSSDDPEREPGSGVVGAPARLEGEMRSLLQFKTSTLTAFGLQRNGVWNEETAAQKVEHFGLMFGALAASPTSPVAGFGAKLSSLTFALLVFPAVWDWYLTWRERRRGFYTKWEVDMLSVTLAIVRKDTGWLRQSPHPANHLVPVPGLVSEADIAAAKADWAQACDVMCKHGRNRIREIARVARVHRDPFEPILPVLEASSPVGEYRRITDEILRLMPDERLHPRAAAEAVRSFLLLRLGLHLGLRQRNLRELLVCPRGRLPTSERVLEERRRGELRWSTRDRGWEVFIPSVAFKNANSSFFGSKPFRLVLPNLSELYTIIEAYLERHRSRLLGPASDPSTFFVKTAKTTSTNAAYDQNTFYEAWRLVIQRYGIYNPYTDRGAIKGLLPHGPHNIRDVLATHILKQTGSYEQASYAIQDTPEMVAKHYGRFLPQDKAAIAAQILNRVWEAA